jgi:hypothetical protein
VKRFAYTLALGMSLYGVSAWAEEWTGVISDAKCGKAHADASAKSQKCVEGCVKGGQAPVLVTGDHVLKIDDASKAKVMDHLGQKVTIDGSVHGDTVTIDSIKAAS